MYVGRIEKLLAYYTLVPMCIINSSGKVTRANKKIADVFKYDGIIDGDIFALTGIKLPEIIVAAKEGTALYLKRNDKAFRILCGFIGEGENASVMMSFIDITSFENLKDLYNEEKPCIALINVDNLEELTPSGKEENELEISTEIDKLIRNWSAGMGAAVSRYKDHMYEMLLTQKNYKQLVVKKFSILDDVRAVETNMDFPVTLSIGIGIGGQMDIAAKLSRKAISTRRWDDVNPDPELAALEAELKDAINGLGLGAAGTGGDTVCLALKMERAHTHTAIAPVAINFHCWVARRAGIRIYNDGRVEKLL